MKQSNCADRHNHKIITFKQNEETTASERNSKASLGAKTKSIKQKRDFDQETLTEVEEGSVQLTSLYKLV